MGIDFEIMVKTPWGRGETVAGLKLSYTRFWEIVNAMSGRYRQLAEVMYTYHGTRRPVPKRIVRKFLKGLKRVVGKVERADELYQFLQEYLATPHGRLYLN